MTDIVNLLEETNPTATVQNRFARGGNYLKSTISIQLVDYVLTVLYLSAFIYTINEIGRWLLGT